MSDLIDDKLVHILWRPRQGDLRVESVLVMERIVLSDESSPRDLAEADRQDREYPASAGSDTADWLDPIDPSSSPAGVFAQIAFHYGFASEDGLEKCLREFAKIRGADWARQMLASIAA